MRSIWCRMGPMDLRPLTADDQHLIDRALLDPGMMEHLGGAIPPEKSRKTFLRQTDPATADTTWARVIVDDGVDVGTLVLWKERPRRPGERDGLDGLPRVPGPGAWEARGADAPRQGVGGRAMGRDLRVSERYERRIERDLPDARVPPREHDGVRVPGPDAHVQPLADRPARGAAERLSRGGED